MTKARFGDQKRLSASFGRFHGCSRTGPAAADNQNSRTDLFHDFGSPSDVP
jgi:hypothetical protein